MAVFGQDRLQQIEVEGDGSMSRGDDEWIVRRLPQFVGRWIQDEVGEHVGDQGEFMLGHGCIYSTALDRPLQRLDSVILERFGKPCGFMVPGACRSRPGSRWPDQCAGDRPPGETRDRENGRLVG